MAGMSKMLTICDIIVKELRRYIVFIKKNKMTGRLIVNLFGLRLKFRLPVKNKHADERLANLLYELADPRTVAKVKLPKVLNLYDTLYALVDSNKSLARFGDGEFKIMMGESINFQKYDKKLAERLGEVLSNNTGNLMVGIPDVFGYCPSEYFRRVLISSREHLYKYMNFERTYCDAFLTRQSKFESESKGNDYYRNLKKLWESKDIVIVEGEGSRLGIGNDLFSNAKSIRRILCPIKDAFSKYDEILASCKKSDGELFIVALGPTATILAYDLCKAGYRALDVGHVDTMYEWFLRKATKSVHIEGKIVFNEERNKKCLKPCKDKKYYEQIITTVE